MRQKFIYFEINFYFINFYIMLRIENFRNRKHFFVHKAFILGLSFKILYTHCENDLLYISVTFILFVR